MNWATLEGAMSTVLATLEIGTFLIIVSTTGDNVFVQYHQSEHGLTAEAVADAHLPASRQLGFDGADAMRALGWRATRRHHDRSGRQRRRGRIAGAITKCDIALRQLGTIR